MKYLLCLLLMWKSSQRKLCVGNFPLRSMANPKHIFRTFNTSHLFAIVTTVKSFMIWHFHSGHGMEEVNPVYVILRHCAKAKGWKRSDKDFFLSSRDLLLLIWVKVTCAQNNGKIK